ncbi:MAG: glycosyltransferase [Burkholderiaceae bacterium]|nr:glycosyltransferase [Burkholderiaceae bacterium]
MKILFVHPQFPGPFQFLAPALAADPAHTVVALTLRTDSPAQWQGVTLLPCALARGSAADQHPWLQDAERQTLRGEATARAALQLRAQGFTPDVVCASAEGGDSLFLRTVWPEARQGLVLGDFGDGSVPGDPEFPPADPLESARCTLNQALLHQAAGQADALWAPSAWLAARWPAPLQERITCVPEGLATEALQPNPDIRLTLNGSQELTRADEVVSFIADTLEPARGCHQFLRSLPPLLRQRPQARVLIVGGHEGGVGLGAPGGGAWRDRFATELRAQLNDAEWARVHFLGAQAPATQWALLQLASVHVALGANLPLERRVLEALALGCAVVAADAPALREALRPGETALLVDPTDPEALGQTVADLLADPARRSALGQQARAWVQAHHDASVALPRQQAWLNALAHPAPAAEPEAAPPAEPVPAPAPPDTVPAAPLREELAAVQRLLQGDSAPGGASQPTPPSDLLGDLPGDLPGE